MTPDNRRRLLGHILAYKPRLALAALFAVVVAACNLFIATLLNWFTAAGQDRAIDGLWIVQYGLKRGFIEPGSERLTLVWIVAILVVAIHIPKAVFSFLDSYLVASVTNRVGADMRRRMYEHIHSLPMRFFHGSRIGDLISRMSSDVAIIQQSSNVLMQAIDGPIMIVGGLARMFMLSWKLSALTIIFVPILGVAIDKLTRRIRALTVDAQARMSDVSSVIDESVRGVRIIKSFGMEAHEVEKFSQVNDSSLRAALLVARRNCMVLPSIDVFGAVAVALVVLAGGWMVARGEVTFNMFMEFTFLAFMVAGAAKQFGRLNVMYQQLLAASGRIFEVIDTESDLCDAPDAADIANPQGKIEFRNVSFEYNSGEQVLQDVSFTVEPGKAVAIVGPSGAGKSTIADLVARFYDVSDGAVMVDGQDVRKLKIASLRGLIAVVPQETLLFSGTISENIAYGRPGASADEIISAATAANAHDFISALPEGYNTRLGEGGVGLSGGQKQRIAIARAILKDPKILILDEATSSLDAASEQAVQDALERLMKNRSTLIIAHRLSTVRGADSIVVIDRGRVAECGTFERLVGSNGMFAQLYYSQISASRDTNAQEEV